MSIGFSLLVTVILILLAVVGVAAGQQYLLGVVIPYAALAIFLLGIIWRVIRWAKSPVPFRIPTTCGQQKSHPWIKNSPIENPHTGWGVFLRMALEVLFFRSLFRNTRVTLREGPRLAYSPNKWLWAAGLAFHWSFLIIILRHLRFFTEPVPSFVTTLDALDGFFQVGIPLIYITDLVILAALTFLFFRRVVSPQLRYISLANDYFPLLLLLGIAVTGVLMRYFFKTDIVGVKELAIGLWTFDPVAPAAPGVLFYIHLFLVCVLLAYFPFSKLVHFAGVFLSPTRNMANNNRMRRHINPWNYPVKVHTYEEWEDEFREVMKAANMPLEKE